MTLDWELYIVSLMLAYNMSFHRSIQNMPHFLTFGIQARQSAFFQEDLNQKFYGENTTDELMQRLQYTRQIAEQNNKYATSKMQEQSHQKAQPQFCTKSVGTAQRFHRSRQKCKVSPKMERPIQNHQFKGCTQSADSSS